LTIAITPAARLFTDFDQLDIADAIRNAVHYGCTNLDARDRQALTLLTYAPGLTGATRTLLAALADGTAALPLPTTQAMHLLDAIGDDILGPEPEWPVQEAWLAARKPAAAEPFTANRVIDAAEAIHRVTNPIFKGRPDARDCKALTRFAAWSGASEEAAKLIGLVLDGTILLPMEDALRAPLLQAMDDLPEVSDAEWKAWTPEWESGATTPPRTGDRVMYANAPHVVTHEFSAGDYYEVIPGDDPNAVVRYSERRTVGVEELTVRPAERPATP